MKKQLRLLLCSFILVGCSNTTLAPTEMPMSSAEVTPIHDPVTGLTMSKIAANMDASDQRQLTKLVALAGVHQIKTWTGHEGNMYEFTSLNIHINDAGEPCRDYQLRALIDGREQSMQATACRMQDADWQITKETSM